MQCAHRPLEGAVGGDSGDMCRAHAASARSVDDGVARKNVEACRGGGLCGRARWIRPEIGDRGDFNTVSMKIQRRLVRAVIVGAHHGAPAGKDGESC